MVTKTIPATAFKAQCLKIMDDVGRRRFEVVVTKRGKPMARILPPHGSTQPSLFGCAREYIRSVGDIISPTGVGWEALKR